MSSCFIHSHLSTSFLVKMNGPCSMYTISPHYEYPKIIEKPKCMYDIPSIYSTNNHPSRIMNTNAVPRTCKGNNDLLKLEERQKSLIKQLEELATKLQQIKQQMMTVPPVLNIVDAVSQVTIEDEIAAAELKEGTVLDVVITASTNAKLIALKVLSCWLNERYRVATLYHTHSSIVEGRRQIGSRKVNQSRSQLQIIITLIWKDVGVDPQLIVSPSHQHTAICGEVNILRYLTSLLLPSLYFHNSVKQTEVDDWLDVAHASILHGNNQERQAALRILGSHVDKQQFLVGQKLSIADVGMLGAILQTQSVNKVSPSIKKWLKNCCSDPVISAEVEALSSLVS